MSCSVCDCFDWYGIYMHYFVLSVSVSWNLIRNMNFCNNNYLNHEIIRIFHGCEVRKENSVPRVIVRHHEVLPSDAEQLSRGAVFLFALNIHGGFFFLHTIRFLKLYLNHSTTFMPEYVAVRYNVLTSLWRCKRDNVRLTTRYVTSYTTYALITCGMLLYYPARVR